MNVLLIDDHPMIIEGYISMLNQPTYIYHKITSCEQFFKWIHKGIIPDIAVVDYNLPPYEDQNLHNGVDCAVLIQQYAPHCKKMLITAHDETLMLYKMYKSVKLDALIVKADFTSDMICEIVSKNSEVPFLSAKAKFALQEVKMKETLLSNINIEILMYLANGFKVSQMNDFLSLSTVAIQKRLNKMLQDFQVTDYHELIQFCKKQRLF